MLENQNEEKKTNMFLWRDTVTGFIAHLLTVRCLLFHKNITKNKALQGKMEPVMIHRDTSHNTKYKNAWKMEFPLFHAVHSKQTKKTG